MADLPATQQTELVRITGSDASGVEQTPVQSTANGAIHTNLRNASGSEIGTSGAPVRVDPTGTTTQPISDAGGSITVDQSGNWLVQGTAADNAATTGNPVKVGGVHNTNLPVLDSGDVGNLQLNKNGQLRTEVTFATDYTTSAIGALRVAETQNVFESLFSFDKQPLIWDETLTTGGTSTHNADTNSVDMTVTTTSGSSVIRQTYRRIRYNPSRTVQFLGSATLGTGKANVRKRFGQFDTLDGVFFEQDGTTMYVVRRTATSGSAVDVRVAQSSWNIDKFDGTGPSGVTIDFSKHNLFYIQYAFQGFGDIVYGFYHEGRVRFCHREAISNVLTLPAFRTAHLPIRAEITNTGTSASSTTFSYNSTSIKNEGQDADIEGQTRSYSNAALKSVSTSVTPVISVRLNSAYQRGIADILKTIIYVQSADEVIWSIWVNPTLTGSTFAIAASYTDLDTAATAMTGGTEIDSGILTQGDGSAGISQETLKYINSLLGVSIAGTSSIITLAARSRVGTADVLSTLVWKEYP